ncbi:transmembrane 4 L6 family member 4-like isoform X2 [Pagrus major]|uniref:transmembrane 4 L6 family member 4-like isoform X2 n=1 Tax=Pagrus major TaxID=143350 RepID=UPI003CC8C3AC
MCTGKCSRCIAYTLYPLVFLSMLCNIILFFPGGAVKYSREGHITEEVKYMGGLIGGGLMVLIPALYISCTGEEGCMGNRCGMFLSIGFAVEGLAGALYSFIVAASGVGNGPLCLYNGQWTTPFKNSQLCAGDSLCHSDDQRPHRLPVWDLQQNRDRDHKLTICISHLES